MFFRPLTIASAFFSIIKDYDQSKITTIIKKLETFYQTFQTNPHLKDTLTHPSVKLSQKIQSLKHYYNHQQKLPEVASLLSFLLKNKQLTLLPIITNYLKKLYDQHFKILSGEIVSANKLKETDIDLIKTKLISIFKVKDLRLGEFVNPQLLGGFVLKLSDTLIDASLKHKLSQIEHSLQ